MQRMNRMLSSVVVVICIVAFITGNSFSAIAQTQLKLTIGDDAPPVKYSKWIKGTPGVDWKDGKLYVLEFWATWCVPCIAAMPHLSELAKKYEGKTKFIGVNVWEDRGAALSESSLPKVTAFVEKNGDRMSYNVIADDNDYTMGNGWLKAALQFGIPSTFVVQDGKIVWVGHPAKLDSVIEPILARTFDVALFKKEFEKKVTDFANMQSGMAAAYDSLKEAVAAKDFQKALQITEEAPKKYVALRIPMQTEKFKILLNNYPEAEALKLGKELMNEPIIFTDVVASSICNKEGLSKNAYLFAADILKSYLAEHPVSLSYNTLADAYIKAGDKKSALAAEEQAVLRAQEEMKKPEMQIKVPLSTVEKYQKKVDQLKKELK
ncbi:thiol-disulfide isomerase/thioredoxin [Filimonas zeae]|uniref:Thioredoxin domain-containing protein n=1 Tax=Filimonas zeae TaxID=1737353 RepID=A0A917INQ8_9BACT|nr:TlpA disulfide reductase family protein [Filimonas zeae]MDR6337714.1 thiol-disulfide isomerase/thioredoxin [Filimonas zeae]GGH59910.1 hypothetical protein GCM10011379_07210 [Filimonas zeae]